MRDLAVAGARVWAVKVVRWLACGAVLLTGMASAQFRASIQGTVTDPDGAAIPGATLTLLDTDTNHTMSATANGSGVYNFNALPPDHFKLTAGAPGFKQQVISNLQLTPEQANAVNVKLDLGEATTTIDVNGDQLAPLETQTASISGTVDSNQIQHMPTAGRDVFQLIQLAPGVFGDGSQGGSGGSNNLPGNAGPGGTSAGAGIFQTENAPQSMSNGGQSSSNGISIDGISTVSAVWGGASVITPTEDSVGSVKIVSNGYDAENGRFSGAQVQVTSKSGTNDVHGSLFFRANRPGLNAYQRYNGPGSLQPGTPAARGLNRNQQDFNQYGGSVGGPLWKDRVFAFFAYETIRSSANTTAQKWYDTPAFDALSATGSNANKFLTFPGAQVASSGLVTQSCANAGLIEGTNCRYIAGQGLNIGSPLKTGLGTQDLGWQSASNPGVGGGLANVADIALYTTVNPTTTTEAQYNGRLDADVTKKDHAAFAIYWVPVDTSSYNGAVRPYNIYHHSAINDAFSVIWNHTFSPTFLNEARANAAGWRWNEVTTNPQAPFGLPTATVDAFGSITSDNLANFGAAGPSVYNQWTYSYKDVATKVAGNHTIKFGGELTRLYYLNNPTGSARPAYNFYNVWDFLNDAPHAETGSFNALTGTPTAIRQDNREDLWGFFVQDDWKARPNLTFNLGMRYSYFGALSAKQNNLNGVVLGTGAAMYTGLSVRRGGNLWEPQKGNFGPQVGFAYSPELLHGKFVLRGGYGLNYNQEEIAISGNAGNNPPSVFQANFTSASPTAINPKIQYTLPADSSTLYGYPSNPNTITTFNTANLPVTGGVGIYAYPGKMPTTYTHHFSLDTQYDLGHQMVATVGYQGSTAHHLIIHQNALVTAAATGVALNPLVNTIDSWQNTGNSNNNSLLVGLKHNMAHHFQFDAEFSLAKSMDDASTPYYEDPYPYLAGSSRGRSDYNVGKAFKIYGLWQPVFWHGSHAWIEKVAGGWSVSGIFNLHTGFPWTPLVNTSGNLYYANSGYTQLRPAAYLGGAGKSTSNDAFKSGPGVGNGTNINYPLAAAQTGTAYYRIPNYTVGAGIPEAPGVTRNSLDGPGYKDVDATLTKAFGLPKLPVLGENARFEIRADAFNLFNNLNFATSSISNVITSSDFGQAKTALGSRTVNLQARFSF